MVFVVHDPKVTVIVMVFVVHDAKVMAIAMTPKQNDPDCDLFASRPQKPLQFDKMFSLGQEHHYNMYSCWV